MKKIYRFIALAICLITIMGSGAGIFAASYTTFTYSLNDFPMVSPDAYTPEIEITSAYMGLLENDGVALDDPRDMVIDDQLNVYLADGANSRITVLNEHYKLKFHLKEFVNDQGVPDSLNTPSGLYVTSDTIYVADTENNRLVLFDREGVFIRIIGAPKDDVFRDNAIYKPVAVAVDETGRIYVVSSTTYEGVIALSNDGVFQGFIGAQKVAFNMLQIIWRRFQTAEQRALSEQLVSTEFNNITIDDQGFIYVTTSSIEDYLLARHIQDKSADYAPVKKLNSSGSDIMKRNGFFGPGGEVNFPMSSFRTNVATGPSKIIDVAMGPENTWTIIDEKRSRTYTYDSDGKLLFVFGDTGYQLGNISSIEAIAYQGDKILILDKTRDSITVYNRTEYGDVLINALHNTNIRRYDLAIDDWQAILQRNSNFDAAYVGIGKAKYREGDWEGAMEYYKFAYDVTNYSEAFKMYRKDWVAKYIVVIPIVIVAVVIGVTQFFKFAGKVNKKTALSLSKRTFGQEILYAFHLIFHPFDGFWDLKHEKRGSLRGAFFFLALTIVTFTYNAVGRAYIFNPYNQYSSILIQVIAILVPILLWVTANWCLTTLFDGEGSFKDIFTAVCYSLLPLPLLMIPAVLITNIITLTEAGMVNLIISFAWVWVGLLVFTGMMVTHDYTLGKNVLTCLGTIVGMAFIMFVALLFTGLLTKMVGFISQIYVEISARL